MNNKKRERNELEFGQWEELPTGERKYWFDIKGKRGGLARYIKTTDADENTLTFVQEIYDSKGKLISIHEKYPVDKGHQKP
jgi:hypothetical protein